MTPSSVERSREIGAYDPPAPTGDVRPDRRYVRLSVIERYWNLDHGYCLRCRQPARCEKAHIITRHLGGLDGVQNLAPLCYPCHADQPPFAPGEERLALQWLANPDAPGRSDDSLGYTHDDWDAMVSVLAEWHPPDAWPVYTTRDLDDAALWAWDTWRQRQQTITAHQWDTLTTTLRLP